MSFIVLPFITTVMPCYNGERYLKKALDAFFSQDYPNKKLVIIDGKSTDHSHEIISSFVERGYPLVWDKTPDKGISSAINIGLAHLNEGDIFGYLGADDILMPNVLSEVANLFRVANGIDGLYFDSYSYLGECGKLTYRKCPTDDFSLANLLKIGTIVGLQNIYIKGELVIANKFEETNKYSMDYDLYLRLYKNRKLNFTYVPFPSTINVMHGNFSTKFEFEGIVEAIHAARRQVGYTPRLLYRLVRLRLSKIKSMLLTK